LYQERGEAGRARAHYEAALEVHREMNDQRSEGDTLAHLADLLRSLGSMQGAWETLAEAESLLRKVNAQVELGQLLCIRAELEHGDGEAAKARRTLSEAEDLARRIGSGPESQLGRDIAKIRKLLEGGAG
jgi:tetratricopeptide (TPR) repeat protein